MRQMFLLRRNRDNLKVKEFKMMLKAIKWVFIVSLTILLGACGSSGSKSSTYADTNITLLQTNTKVYLDKNSLSYTFKVPNGYEKVTDPRFGSLSYNQSSDSYTYRADTDLYDYDEVLFHEKADSSSARNAHLAIAITFSNPNVAPVAKHGYGTLMQDASTLIELNASDRDGDALSYEVLTVSHGNVTSCTTGVCSFTPTAGYYGSAYIEFRAYDGEFYSDAKTYNLAIHEKIQPYAFSHEFYTDENTPLAITLQAFDFNFLPLTYTIVANPSGGVITHSGTNVTYTPNANFLGYDSFQFRVHNGSEFSLPGTIYIKVKPVPQPWLKIESKWTHTAAIKNDGTLWLWGSGQYGQLGDGNTSVIGRWEPWRISLDTWSDVSAGGTYTLAIKSDGTLWAWGLNGSGRLGVGDTVQRDTPTQVGTDTDWAKVAAGTRHSLGIKNNGTLWAWGLNGSGQLGIDNYNNRSSPVQVGTDTWLDISAGNFFSLGIKSDGSLWAWGDRSDGKLGLDTTLPWQSYRVPQQISAGPWQSVDAGSTHSFAIKSDGTLWSWGLNYSGELGDGTTVKKTAPVQVGTDTWSSVTSYFDGGSGLKTNGKLFRWGRVYGAAYNEYTIEKVPLQLGTSNWKALSRDHAIRNDDTLWGWWFNFRGQVGNGVNTFQVDPVQID